MNFHQILAARERDKNSSNRLQASFKTTYCWKWVSSKFHAADPSLLEVVELVQNNEILNTILDFENDNPEAINQVCIHTIV